MPVACRCRTVVPGCRVTFMPAGHGDPATPRIVTIRVPERALYPLAPMLIAFAIGTAERYIRLLPLTWQGSQLLSDTRRMAPA